MGEGGGTMMEMTMTWDLRGWCCGYEAGKGEYGENEGGGNSREAHYVRGEKVLRD